MLYYLQGRKMNLALAYIFNIVIGLINLLGLLIWFNIGTVALKNWFGQVFQNWKATILFNKLFLWDGWIW